MEKMKIITIIIFISYLQAFATALDFVLVTSDRGAMYSASPLPKNSKLTTSYDKKSRLLKLEISLTQKGNLDTLSIDNLPNDFLCDSAYVVRTKTSLALYLYNYKLDAKKIVTKRKQDRGYFLLSQKAMKEYHATFVKKEIKKINSLDIIYRDDLYTLNFNGSEKPKLKIKGKEGYSILMKNISFSTKKMKLPKNFVIKKGKLYISSKLQFIGSKSRNNLEQFVFSTKEEAGKYKIISWNSNDNKIDKVNLLKKPISKKVEKKEIVKVAPKKVTPNKVEKKEIVKVAPKKVTPNKVEKKEIVKVVPKKVVKAKKKKEISYFVIKYDVNFRSTSNTSDDNLISRLKLGEKLVLIKKENNWINVIKSDNSKGWVYHTMVAESSLVTTSQWDVIRSIDFLVEEDINIKKSSSQKGKKAAFDITKTAKKGKVPSITVIDKKVEKVEMLAQDTIRAYQKYGRDPFLPLDKSEFLKPKLPIFDNIELVGIIYDEYQPLALFQELIDRDIVAFSMKINDKIANGRVVEINENNVIFLMQEADVSYTVKKELKEKKK